MDAHTARNLEEFLTADVRDADSLDRSAAYFERNGMPATAMLFRNAAFVARFGGSGMDDAEVRE